MLCFYVGICFNVDFGLLGVLKLLWVVLVLGFGFVCLLLLNFGYAVC